MKNELHYFALWSSSSLILVTRGYFLAILKSFLFSACTLPAESLFPSHSSFSLPHCSLCAHLFSYSWGRNLLIKTFSSTNRLKNSFGTIHSQVADLSLIPEKQATGNTGKHIAQLNTDRSGQRKMREQERLFIWFPGRKWLVVCSFQNKLWSGADCFVIPFLCWGVTAILVVFSRSVC